MIKRTIPLLILCFFLMGQEECDSPTPPPPDTGPCNPVGPMPTIVGGGDATERHGTVYMYGCSGVVVGPHTVLTAAHCGKYNETHCVRLKRGDLCEDGWMIEDRLEHPDYYLWGQGDLEARKSDIQLVYTEEKLPEPYVNLNYDPRYHSGECTKYFMQGWGLVSREPDNVRPMILQEADIYILENKGKTFQVDLIEEGGGCYGDSGGPAYAYTTYKDIEPLTWLLGTYSTHNQLDCKGENHIVSAIYNQDWIRDNTR